MSLFDEYLSEMLGNFDSMDISVQYIRRLSVKPLWDYCQTVLLEYGVYFCGLDRNSLKNTHLATRWIKIKPFLEVIDDPSLWDQLINTLQSQRSKVEHNDYFSPEKDALTYIRDNVKEFKNWCFERSQTYYRESKGYDLIKYFTTTSDIYSRKASYILDQCGENPPYTMNFEYVTLGKAHPYQKFKKDYDELNQRYKEIIDIRDVKKSDLEALINIIIMVERYDANEGILLSQNICPLCGGKIIETQIPHGGNEYDPAPHSITYRTGCERCHYEIVSETINL